jgi:hypothetical protein
MLKIFGTLTLILTLASCSTMRSMALKTAAPLFMDSMAGIEAESNWEAFKEATPGNLSLIDGLLAVRPHDENLLVAAIKGNAGYAFGVHETLYLSDKLAENDKTFHKDQAIAFYAKAFDYGQSYLKENDLSLQQLLLALKDKYGVAGLLESQLSGDQVSLEGILFTAQALGSMINLQRENIQLVSYLPVVKGMFDWACEIDPNIGHGMCQIFYGSYEAGRPAMLGGNPEKGREIFEKMIKEQPHNWLARVAFIEYFAIPQYSQDVYNRQKKDLMKYEELLKNKLNWSPNGQVHEAFQNKRLGLYQAIAIKRFQIIRKYENDIF